MLRGYCKDQIFAGRLDLNSKTVQLQFWGGGDTVGRPEEEQEGRSV